MVHTYKIILQQIEPGKDIKAVKQVIAYCFRLSPDNVDSLLPRIPLVVKQHTDYATAKKIQKIMADAGVECRLEPDDEKFLKPSSAVGTEPTQSGETKKTCPKCGYQAHLPDDPLLTAHQGQGECPACGVIVAKYLKSEQDVQETLPPDVATGTTAPEEESPDIFTRFFSLLNLFPKPLLIVVLLLIALLVYPWVKGKPPGGKTAAPAHAPEKVQQPETVTDSFSRTTAPNLKILPGETKSFTISCLFPVIHEDTFSPSPSLSAMYQVIKNPWEDIGAYVQVKQVSFVPSSVLLWERKQHDSAQWNLITQTKDVHITKLTGFSTIANPSEESAKKMASFLNSLMNCNNPALLRNLAEKSRDEITRPYKGDYGEIRQHHYVLYELKVVLSVSLSTGLEFATRDTFTWTTETGQEVKTGQRSTEVLISSDGVAIDYENSRIVLSLKQWAGLTLLQKADEEGVFLLPSSNMSFPWTIEPS